MKRILTAVTTFLSLVVMAQDNPGVKKFMDSYTERGISIPGGKEQPSLIGKQMPGFYFDEQLNSKALKGKSIVLDFWATWCGGCLLLSRDLDSLMIETTDAYKNVQIIGVNTKEKMADKGYNAREYWKKSGKRFPMVDGAAADSCGASVDNGFPTVMLVDPEGIIRGRWDAWTPSTANAVRIHAWKYSVLPGLKDTPINIANARALMKKNDWISALYFLESMPATDSVNVLRFEAMLHVSEDKAAAFAVTLKEKIKDAPQYGEMAARMLHLIAASGSSQTSLIATGIAIGNELRRKMEYANSWSFVADRAKLHWMNAQNELKKARQMIDQSINMAGRDGNASKEIGGLKGMKEVMDK